MEYEAMELIEMMYSMIAEAKAMPLAAGRCIIERNDMLSMLEELRDSLPREMEEARRLWEAKEEFIASAKREAEQIRMEAEQKARQMVEEEEIVKPNPFRNSALPESTPKISKTTILIAAGAVVILILAVLIGIFI